MTSIYIPAPLRDLTGGAEQVEVEISPDQSRTVREVLAELEILHPGLEDRLLSDGDLAPGLAVFIDGEEAGMGLMAKVREGDQLYFLAPIVGGI